MNFPFVLIISFHLIQGFFFPSSDNYFQAPSSVTLMILDCFFGHFNI